MADDTWYALFYRSRFQEVSQRHTELKPDWVAIPLCTYNMCQQLHTYLTSQVRVHAEDVDQMLP